MLERRIKLSMERSCWGCVWRDESTKLGSVGRGRDKHVCPLVPTFPFSFFIHVNYGGVKDSSHRITHSIFGSEGTSKAWTVTYLTSSVLPFTL